MEVKVKDKPISLEVFNTILITYFDQQQNIIKFKNGSERQSKILSKNTKFITIASLKGIHGILTENNQKRPLFYLYEVLLYFKNAKIYKIEKINSISGVKLVKEEKMYYLLI